MTDIDDLSLPRGYDAFLGRVRSVKEDVVAMYDGTDQSTDDITPAVWATFGDIGGVLVVAPQIDRDMGLAACRIVGLTGADTITFMADSHLANDPINPATGEQWGPGEMQNACDVEGACSVGLLDDCLMVTTVWRDNDRTRGETLVYTVTKGQGVGGSTIAWKGTAEPMVIDTAAMPDTGLDGLVYDGMRSGFREAIPEALQQVAREEGLDTEQQAISTMVGGILALESVGFLVMVYTDNPDLKERLDSAHEALARVAHHG